MMLRTKGEQKAHLDGYEMCGECHRRYCCYESPDSCTYAKVAQSVPEQEPEPSLDDAIARAEEKAKANEAMCESYSTDEAKEHIRKCAADHRQLAEWLRELKAYKAEEYTCDGCKHFDHGDEIECWACSRHHIKKYDNWEAKE